MLIQVASSHTFPPVLLGSHCSVFSSLPPLICKEKKPIVPFALRRSCIYISPPSHFTFFSLPFFLARYTHSNASLFNRLELWKDACVPNRHFFSHPLCWFNCSASRVCLFLARCDCFTFFPSLFAFVDYWRDVCWTQISFSCCAEIKASWLAPHVSFPWRFISYNVCFLEPPVSWPRLAGDDFIYK